MWSISERVLPYTARVETMRSPALREREERGVNGRHAGAEGEACLRAMELGECIGQGGRRGVLDARVGVSRPAEADELSVVVDVLGVEGG
jgi:hypothetical protein